MKTNTYKLEGIDCASCALKIEESVSALEGVEYSSMNFMFMRFKVTFDESIIEDSFIETTMHKSLPDFRIIEKNNQEFEDTYSEPNVFKKMLFRPKRNRK